MLNPFITTIGSPHKPCPACFPGLRSSKIQPKFLFGGQGESFPARRIRGQKLFMLHDRSGVMTEMSFLVAGDTFLFFPIV
jgi:hypothetical protein